MQKSRPYFSALWLLLILFPMLTSTYAQTSGNMEVKVRLLEPLDSSKTKAGQVFSATIAAPVVSGKRVVLAQGTAVEGRVTEVTRPGRMKTPASMTLLLTNVLGTHRVNAFQSQALQVDGSSHAVRNVALIGGGAAAGAVLGGVASGEKGALIGAGVGAAAGTATAYLTGKQELVLPVETELAFVVDARSLGVTPPEPPRAPAVMQTSIRRGRGEDRDREHAGDRDREQDAFDSLIFSERDQGIIRSYYRPHGGRGLPPGLAKRDGNLPPGLEKQLHANGTLPPGLQKRVEPFPLELDRKLPRLPRGYSRVTMDGRAMTLDVNSRIIDVFVVF
jgi:hypothetical protein